MGHRFTIDVDGAECVLAVDEGGLTVGRGAAVLHRSSWSDLLEVAVPTSLSARLSFAGQDPLTLRFSARKDRDAFRPWAERRGAVGPPAVATDQPPATASIPMHTLPAVPGRRLVESLGLVTAQSVMSRRGLSDTRTHLDGAPPAHHERVEKAVGDAIRAAALDLSAAARALGADAVVAVSVSTAGVGDNAEAVIVAGTAVRTVPAGGPT